ncbi:MAG: 4Fe-4S binding protein [Proteobacteria bacterium]|nr:4Fe-4S binding protein [Pseudomonadota bacterium]
MSEEVYRRLQRHLHQHPMGFPPTKSGVEIKLLSKMFEPEEAEITLAMAARPERPEDIAGRLGLAPEVLSERLETMARKGLIMRRRSADGLTYNLEPYVFGICEFQIHRLDLEFLDLMDRYAVEAFGKEIWAAPSPYFRVIPTQRSISTQIEVYPYDRVTEIIERAEKIAVADCFCRVSAKMRGKGCDAPLRNCMMFSSHAEYYVENGWPARMVDRREALDILKEADEAGLIHNTQNAAAGPQVICNCCTCCCGIMGTVKQFNLHERVGRSDYYSHIDEDECVGCGECVERCPFEAIFLENDTARVNLDRCLGCGLCTAACSTGALTLHRKPADQIVSPFTDVEAMYDHMGREKGRPMKVRIK